MIQLRSSLMYMLIFTIVASFLAYKIVVSVYDTAFAEYDVLATTTVAK